jgi:tRNA nucleotidyltransferase/poly(A) polymerase
MKQGCSWKCLLMLTVWSVLHGRSTRVMAWTARLSAQSARWTMMALDSRELRFFHRTKVPIPSVLSPPSPPESPPPPSSRVWDHDVSRYIFSSDPKRRAAATFDPVLASWSMAATTTTLPLSVSSSCASLTATVEAVTTTTVPYFLTSERFANILDTSNKIQTVKSSGSSSFRSNQDNGAGKPVTVKGTTSRMGAGAGLGATRNFSSQPPQTGYGPSITLTPEEQNLFELLRRVRGAMGLQTTLRVAGGWVRDKLLATPEFRAYHRVFAVGSDTATTTTTTAAARLTSKFRQARNSVGTSSGGSGNASMGRQGTKVLISPTNRKGNDDATGQPVDIDIALDDMLGREFADRLNEYLSARGRDTVSVGMVLKNPEKSKHLETATMKVGSFWIDFVNLRAEEYTQDSRIPDLMRIGTAEEDAFRRDLTINALFYNINTGQVEDWTGRGFQDLRKGVISTPLHPLTTLLDDPLRVLRSIRFAARLRFTIDEDLVNAARTASVASALSQKVSRERVGGELDLMLRSPDPVGAVRLLINLKLVGCVFPIASYYEKVIAQQFEVAIPPDRMQKAVSHVTERVFQAGLELLSTSHDHLADCRWSPPAWCVSSSQAYGTTELRLIDDEEARRLLWYAAFLKPQYDEFKVQQAQAQRSPRRDHTTKKANRSIVVKMLVDELKRPLRDADSVETIIKAADDFTQLLDAGCDVSATMILLSDIHVSYKAGSSASDKVSCDLETENCENGSFMCSMNGRSVNSQNEDDPVWEHAMEFRLLCAKVLQRVGPLWRAALFLAISEELVKMERLDGIEYAIEGDVIDESHDERRQGVLERFDTFAAALQQLGLVGIWNEKPVADGNRISKILPWVPKGPIFREVMDEQMNWMVTHPGAGIESLEAHLKAAFPKSAVAPHSAN